jgi:hypothetical protein
MLQWPAARGSLTGHPLCMYQQTNNNTHVIVQAGLVRVEVIELRDGDSCPSWSWEGQLGSAAVTRCLAQLTRCASGSGPSWSLLR